MKISPEFADATTKTLFGVFNSPTASILILRTHNPVTTKGDHQWVLQRLFLVEPSRQLAISELFPFSFCLFMPSTTAVKGYDRERSFFTDTPLDATGF